MTLVIDFRICKLYCSESPKASTNYLIIIALNETTAKKFFNLLIVISELLIIV